MAEARPTLIRGVAVAAALIALAGCRRGLPSHEGASFGVANDGKTLAWTTGAGGQNELWIRDESGSRRIAGGRFFESPAFTPEGQLVVGEGDSIRNRMKFVRVSIKDGARETLLDWPEHSVYSATFAADGRMAFRGAAKPRSRALGGLQWHAFDLYVATPKDGVYSVSEIKRLSEGRFIRMSAPSWSDDYRKISFSYLDDSGVSWLRVVDIESGKTEIETKLVNNESMPVFIGGKLAIVSDRENAGRYRLAFVDPDSGETEPITQSESYFLEPMVAGGAIYALEDATHKMRFRVAKVDPKTGLVEEVLPESAFDAAPKQP